MTDEQIKYMTERFLTWKLPMLFAPDGGITFEHFRNVGTPYEARNEPTGTNLLHAGQAEAMIRHLVAGLPEAAPSSPGDGWEPIETAPRDNKTAIIVLTETGRIFKATYRFCVSENEHGECDAWCVDEDDPRPDCWTEGLCWAENEDGNPSDQPAYWKPLGPLPAAPSPGGDHGA